MHKKNSLALAVVLMVGFGMQITLAQETVGRIEQRDPALAELIDTSLQAEVLSTGHQWTEGPVWIKSGGHLLFSDVPRNKIHKWDPEQGHSVFMDPSGFDGDNGEKEPGLQRTDAGLGRPFAGLRSR